MVKQAPTPARLAIMVAFALSCFGLLLFLWVTFGGSVPFQPKGYRIEVAFPEATQLGTEADVRVAGVSIGKVRSKVLDPHAPNRTLATLEIDSKYAPIASDAKATLRQKTLLGETYVEMTLGTPSAPKLKEGGELAPGQVKPDVQLDEIFQAFDPTTRRAFQRWQRDLAQSFDGRGTDFNDVLGTLPTFADDGDDLLEVLDAHGEALSKLISNTGVVFDAISQNQSQLQSLVVNTGKVFDVTARRQNELASIFRALPTFQDESKATLARVARFSQRTDPLIKELRPVAQDLRPTLADLQAASPDLVRVFHRLDPLINVSKTGLPALKQVLDGTGPVLDEIQPFLEQLNPILQWLEYHQRTVADFLANGAGALADTIPDTATPEEQGHYLRQFGPKGAETAAMYTDRSETPNARGNAYLNPGVLSGPQRAQAMMFPNWDCNNTTVHTSQVKDSSASPSCFIQAAPTEPAGNTLRFPHIEAADYSKKP